MRIERIGAEGDGIAHLSDGTPLYVGGGLPDEIVRVRPFSRRGEGWAAAAESILRPSPERAAPPCPHFGACGGCALQHWQDVPYAAWKAGLLRDALQRAGYADPPVADLVRTPAGARRRADLAVRRTEAGIVVGLHATGSSRVVDLRSCPVLHPTLFALRPPLRASLAGLQALRRAGSAVVNLLDDGPDVLLRTDAPLSAADRARLAQFGRASGVPRVAWGAGDGPAETVFQVGAPHIRLSGVAVTPPPGAFLQASVAGERAIVQAVLAGLPAPSQRVRVAEFHAGCGTLTFALAAMVRVSAWEGDADAAAALIAAARQAGLAGRVEAEQRDLVRRPVLPPEMSRFAAAVLDPPHAGAPLQVAHIAAARVPRVIYVSCNPAALRRDARVLQQTGYRLLAATPIDQFLWSARLESVVVFGR